MTKICNQCFVNDILRNKEYTATIKCICCGEESNFTEPFPVQTRNFIKWLNDFGKLHKNKGCNKTYMDAPDWAAKDVSFGFSI